LSDIINKIPPRIITKVRMNPKTCPLPIIFLCMSLTLPMSRWRKSCSFQPFARFDPRNLARLAHIARDLSEEAVAPRSDSIQALAMIRYAASVRSLGEPELAGAAIPAISFCPPMATPLYYFDSLIPANSSCADSPSWRAVSGVGGYFRITALKSFPTAKKSPPIAPYSLHLCWG